MKNLLLKGYEGLTVLLPFLVTFVILSLFYKHKRVTQNRESFLMLFVFSIYLFAVFHFTGISTIFDVRRFGLQLNASQVNLIPFSRHIDVMAYFLNVLLFVPFGFLMPFIWSDFIKLKYMVLSGAFFSLFIEVSQLFNIRQTDVDDVIMNTLGAILGYMLYRMFHWVTKKQVPMENHFKWEPAIYILAIYFGHFLMFNEFGMAKLLYGF